LYPSSYGRPIAGSPRSGRTPAIFFETFVAVGFRGRFARFGMVSGACQPRAGDFGAGLVRVV
jgi:hypothetical protein